MSFKLETIQDGAVLTLTGRLSVQHASALWELLQPVLAAKMRIELNTEGLDEMDTSIIQILCRAGHAATPLRIPTSSEGFTASLRRRGMAGLFPQTSDAIVSAPELPSRKPVASGRPAIKSESKRRLHG